MPTNSKKAKQEALSLIEQYKTFKSVHPDAIILFRCGDFYETYDEDAQVCGEVLGITITRNFKEKDDEGHGLRMAGFPHHALDAYLPKLIRSGHRVAICDNTDDVKVVKEEKPEPVATTPEKEDKENAGVYTDAQLAQINEWTAKARKEAAEAVKDEILDALFADGELPDEIEQRMTNILGMKLIIKYKHSHGIALNVKQIDWLINFAQI